MQIDIGLRITLESAAPTPTILMLKVHPTRAHDLAAPEALQFDPPLRSWDYIDRYGNTCTRVTLPAGLCTITSRNSIADSGLPDTIPPDGAFTRIEDLPPDTLIYLLASRYCETDKLADFAWGRFGLGQAGLPTVRAICDFVHGHLKFDYMRASATRSAHESMQEGWAVCRDFAHLAIALCRCMGIPARYVAGYMGDIGVPPDDSPMDFSGWFECWLGDRWYTFDARHNRTRIGRIPIAYGRDAADVAITTTFGKVVLREFEVLTVEAKTAAVQARA